MMNKKLLIISISIGFFVGLILIGYGLVFDPFSIPFQDYEQLPDEVKLYWETIRHGALYKLLSQQGKAWTNAGGAQYCYGEFQKGVTDAKRDASRDNNNPQRTVKYGGIY